MITKEHIIKEIEKYGCKKLEGLPLHYMTKDQILRHLEDCKCPKLADLKKEIKK